MRKLMLPFAAAVVICAAPPTPTQAPEQRAAALVARMTVLEKAAQLQDRAPAIPRLSIPPYGWWNEALHGVARNGLATVFPQAIGLAATWDTNLEFRIADAVSTEARAKYNVAIHNGQHGRYQGLTFWSPNINIFRDPRWGRGQETYGEDPYLTASMATQFIRGLQGSDPRYFKTIATSKHFAVHSGPEIGRHSFDAQVDAADLDATYLPAFRTTITSARAYSVMCAYNRVNGSPACANTDLLDTRLRKAWGFQGYVVSDCGAIDDIYSGHHDAATIEAAAAKALKAGTDLDCGTEYSHLPQALQKGLITENDLDVAVTRLLTARIRLGLLDSSGDVPFNRIGPAEIASSAHAALALEAAEKSIVLLKNEARILPFTMAPANIAVIGPAADEPDTLLGNYYGTPPHLITPLAGITQQFAGKSQIHYALGSLFVDSMPALISPENFASGVKAEYFNNADLSGIASLTRTEPRVFFHWAMADGVIRSALPQPTFSARFTATLRPPFSGDYQLGFTHQECDSCPGNALSRLSVDGQVLVDEARKSAGGAGSATKPIHLEAGRTYELKLEYRQHDGGSGVELVWQPPAAPLLQQAIETAAKSDAVILCVGLNSRLEGEESHVTIPGFAGGDRTDLNLPAGQQKLLNALLDTGKPVIVVLLNGSALAVETAAARSAALLEAWYPGQEGGLAIARTLAGENNPAGRLPVTFYHSASQLPPFTDYHMEGRTYRYFNGRVLFSFGYGLSYAAFTYEKLPAANGTSSARITNTSKYDGDEVAQLYQLRDNGHWQLTGFERIRLRAGESRIVTFPAPGTRWEIAGSLPNAAAGLKTTNAPRP